MKNKSDKPTGEQIDSCRWKDYTYDPVTKQVVHKKTLARLTWWRKWRQIFGDFFRLGVLFLAYGG